MSQWLIRSLPRGCVEDSAGMLLGIPIGTSDLVSLTAEALSAVNRNRPQIVFACVNPHSLVTARMDDEFRQALINGDQLVADGVGVTIMAKLAGVHVGPRITGSDYFGEVMRALQQRGAGRVFFFGSSRKVLDLISKRVSLDFPSLTLCGTISPPYGDWSSTENDRMIHAITDSRADVLWVGMTAPKQEKWVGENRHRLDVPVIGSIGAVFDFYAGTYPRAPQWLCRTGMEWAYRMMREPRRMWQRNLISTPRFIALVLWHHLIRARI